MSWVEHTAPSPDVSYENASCRSVSLAPFLSTAARCLRDEDARFEDLVQGVLHCARALEHTPSLHITVGLHRSAMSVASILAAVVTAQTLGVGECSHDSHGGRDGQPE